MSVDVRPARPEDAVAIARIHAEAFPDYFLTHLGPSFLRRYYSAFLRPTHTVVLGSVDGRPAGFVAGTTDLAAFRRHLYRPNIVAFPALVVVRFARDPMVRREAAKRLHHVGLALRALVDRREIVAEPSRHPEPSATSEFSAPSATVSYLFSICVSPAARGTGLANAVMSAYVDEERRRGATSVQLSVFADNPRAIRFYERGGWHEIAREGDSIVFELDLGASDGEDQAK